MSLEQHYRDTMDTLTRDPDGRPDLSAAIAIGRRRRRTRRTALAGAGLAAVAIAAVVGVSLARDDSSIAVDAGPSGAAHPDFVPGSGVDEAMQATVASHLPALAAATDVYPSDWNHSHAITDFADATEWHALYDVSGSETLRVVMSEPIPGQPLELGCARIEQTDIPCRRTELPDGSTEQSSGYVLDGSTYRFMTIHVATDGSVVETLDDVQAGSVAEANATRTLTDSALASLVEDPALTFPAPAHTPAPPSSQR